MAFEDVIQILTDMGTEFGIVDYMNILPSWLRARGATVRATDTDTDWLFPNALKVPGPLPHP